MTEALRAALQRQLDAVDRAGAYAEAHRYVLAYGRPFEGIRRPKGFGRQRARKQCYMNASLIAEATGATYVEGFAMRADMPPFQHAWVTVDGLNAIDQTLPEPERYGYFGIPFPAEVLVDALAARQYYGLLDPVEPGLLRLPRVPGGNRVAKFA